MNEIILILSIISTGVAIINLHIIFTDKFKSMWFVYNFSPYLIFLDIIIILLSIIAGDIQSSAMFMLIAYMKYYSYMKVKKDIEE